MAQRPAQLSAYDVQHQRMLDEILTDSQRGVGAQTQAGKDMGLWDWIACQFTQPVAEYPNAMWDMTWEGFAVVDEGNQTRLVPQKAPGYSVFVLADGRCVIPNTPNNARRLDNPKMKIRIIKDAEGNEISRTSSPEHSYIRLLETPQQAADRVVREQAASRGQGQGRPAGVKPAAVGAPETESSQTQGE